MTTPGETRAQEALEARLLQIWAGAVPEDQTVEEVFGPYESWLLSLGSHQLLLHPVLKEWLYLDPLHDTWERTGFGPEQVIFVVQGDQLGARKKGTAGETGALEAIPAEEPPAGAQAKIVCPRCREQAQPGTRFCTRCGAPLQVTQPGEGTQPQAVACPSCGYRNTVGARFCSQCGTRLDQGSSKETAGA